uniref:Gamma-tubulin complex component 6 n=1 Tax=Cyprinus carpio TaxID=7962 RepID=A0A8C2BG36_CYPCA
MISGSITGLLGALCDCGLSGLSWKRRALGAASRESARRSLRKRAYGALLAGLFQDGSPKPPPNALANTPAHNKILMISFDLRVSGHNEEAERLEELLSQLQDGADSSGLSELDSVLELLVQLAGSVAPPPLSFSHDYMRRERPVQRRPPLGGYLSRDMQRLEERAWSLICGEEWGVFGGICRTLSIMDAPPGTGLLGLGRRQDTEERFERETRLSLFGALQHSRTADMDVRLDLPPVPSNADLTGLSIRVPLCLDQSDDEGFQSASNLTPDSQSETSPSPEIDVWEALRTFVPGRRRCWENIGCPPGQKDPPYLTEAGREAFDQLYRLWEGEMRNILSTQTPSPLLPLPLDCQSQLVKDVLNVLIGVSSVTFPLNEVTSVQFDVRPDICVSGTSPESVSRLLGELAQYGTHYLRLSRFSLSSTSQKGLVFQAFTGGLRRYLHYYRACVLSTPASLSLLTIACHFRKLGRQLRYLSELCCVDGIGGVGRAAFPVGVKLLSCLYNEAQSNCSNENHPVLLSLLKSSCEPYTRFVSDWVYSGVFRDVYKEFMIEVNEDYLTYRDKNFWTQGYTLISCDAEDCVPVFLKHIANDVYVCGKTINLLKICCPQHYIFWSDVPVPRIAVTFSLQEVEEIERDCAVYRGRMETIARHSAISREEKAMRTEQARQELINLVRVSAAKTLERIRGQKSEAQKRERFEELKQQLELDQEWRSAVRRKQQEDDFSYARELRDREQRLQALEEQLERRARMDLITQYSQLSEAAARRELRAMWKVQRMKLDERRVNFLQQEQQNVQLSEQQNLREQQIADPPLTESFAPLCSPAIGETQALKSEEIDIADFLPKPLYVPDSGAMTQALHNIGSDLLQSPQKPHPQQPHPSTSHICGTTSIRTPNIHGLASDAHIRVGDHVSEVTTSIPTPNIHGHASDAHIRVGEHVSEVTTLIPMANIHGHASDAHIRVRKHVAEGTSVDPGANRHGHDSDAHIRVRKHVAEGTSVDPGANRHGHDSDAHIRVRKHVAEGTSVDPGANRHGHASDAHIRVGEHVSEVTNLLPTPNIHGHASDAHIRVGEHVSEVTNPLPTPNIHGHASDAHIRVGEHVSEVTNPIHTANIHGHASDAHIKVGEFVSDVASSQPRWSKYGHSSDSTLKVGCVMPYAAPSLTPLPGSSFGHTSDSTLTVGCVVSGVDPQPSPLPGSAYGHSSQSTLGIGCVVRGTETTRPSSLYSSAYGHSSDSALGMGCMVGGVVPGSLYGDRPPSKSDRTSEDAENLAIQAPPSELFSLDEGLSAWALGLGLSPKESPEDRYLLSLALQYQVEQYQDSYGLMSEYRTFCLHSELLLQVTRGPNGLPVDPSLHRSTDATAVQLNEMMPLPVLMKHSVTTPLITQYAVVDYFFVELGVEKHFETLRHFLLMEDGEFALSLSDQLFEKLGSGQTPGELLTPLVLNSILNKALQYSVHGDSELAAHFTFALRYLPEIFHPHAPDSLNCLELRYKVDWPVNIVITDSCLNKYNRLFSFLLQLKHMVWSLRDVWFHLKRTALVKGAGRSAQFHQLQLYRHEMQHFVKVIQGYIANQILQVSWSEFTHKLSSANDLDAIHRTHAEYLNRAIFRGLLTEKAAPVMNIIHSIFSLILKFRGQLIAQPWELQQGEPVHPSFIAMQQSYNTFKYYSRFLFKVVTKLVDKGYQPHLEDFLLRINLNNYYKDS